MSHPIQAARIPAIRRTTKIDNDAQLWKMFRQGSEDAFKTVYLKYLNTLITYGRRFTSDRDLVLDCIHDMFVKLRSSTGSTDAENIKAYLFSILRRDIVRCIQKFRACKSYDHRNCDNFMIAIEPNLHFIEEELNQSKLNKLNCALNNLSARQKESILYYFYEGFTYEEIAQIMELKSPKYSRKLIDRGLKSMERKLYK